MKNKKAIIIFVAVIISAIIMNVVDGMVKPPYAVKSAIKIMLFSGVPVLYFLAVNKGFDEVKILFKPSRKTFVFSITVGVIIYAIITGAYLLLKEVLDFSAITSNLTGDSGITKDNFIFVALYISFCNSLLEEFFFRGFAFIALKKHANRVFAYIFSAFIFAFYHVGMTLGWVNFGLFALGFFGLFLDGVIFNFLNERSQNIYCSWIIHMFINFAINTIGCMLFGII